MLVATMLFSGCTGESDNTQVNESETMIEEDLIIVDDVIEEETQEEIEQKLVSVPDIIGCDNTNPIHCMLPFPSHAFLREDGSTETGFRMNYSTNTIPGSGITPVVSIPIINTRDGVSPATQIMTSFHSDPDLSLVAGQYSIERSLESNHNTQLLNMKTGLLEPHWVELDVRSEQDQPTILHIRTIQALDHNTSYGVAIHGLVDNTGNPIEPHDGFVALRDSNLTDSSDIEAQRENYEVLFTALTSHTTLQRKNLQAAWMFHTSSTESLIGDVIHMRNDAMERIGPEGLGCSIVTNDEHFNNGNRTHSLITGTYTAPQYTNSFYPPTLINRDEQGTPEFVENREIPFWLMIPNSAMESGIEAPLTVWGHGFLGDGNTSALWGWGNENNVAMIGTSAYGWSSDDVISIEYAVLDSQLPTPVRASSAGNGKFCSNG